MWVKICGMTSAAAVDAAVASGADAVGFVFAPSPRELAPAAAAALARAVRGRARCVAVMRHPTQAAVDDVLAQFVPDVLQTDRDDLAGLRLPATLECLPVVRGGSAAPPSGALPPWLLFEGPLSGAGRVSDWEAARRLAARTRLVLAGGLAAANVAQAIAAVGPWGVDVSSGVEGRPGVKDPAMIAEFVAAARAGAARRTEGGMT